ncbi:hypothetical protein [Alloactinosynnema sp. L-07]|uniref:hypothetical protein n=1 Tax=Alloactinosynnema sp. L-07 TaxID=1653480 RepID=UPI00065EF381|nr:hypothetical protein [Alloactinosynnema sp. L-07]CRK62210.1 hypothetical protein [Alloactinosynnema sp. L-07]
MDGTAVVVTGAGRGLGAAFAAHLARAGAAVVWCTSCSTSVPPGSPASWCAAPGRVHIVGQPSFADPAADTWDLDSVDEAFTEVFQAHLEPNGLEKRLPPRLRKWPTAALTA